LFTKFSLIEKKKLLHYLINCPYWTIFENYKKRKLKLKFIHDLRDKITVTSTSLRYSTAVVTLMDKTTQKIA